MSNLTPEEDKLYKQLEETIDRKEQIDQILQSASENDLRAVLVDASKYYGTIDVGYQSYTLTLLGSVIHDSNQRNIEAILGTANDKGILKEVLNTPNITVEFQGGIKRTLTPLAFAICMSNQKSIGAILDAASDKGILKEVFAGIEKDDRERIKHLLKGAENQDMLSKIDQVEKDIENEAVKANPSSNENVSFLWWGYIDSWCMLCGRFSNADIGYSWHSRSCCVIWTYYRYFCVCSIKI